MAERKINPPTEISAEPEFTKIQEVDVVPARDRRTSNMLTNFEYTEVVSIRAQQLVDGCEPWVDIGNETSPIKIAEMEIKAKKCPLAIERAVGTQIEIWNISEMILP